MRMGQKLYTRWVWGWRWIFIMRMGMGSWYPYPPRPVAIPSDEQQKRTRSKQKRWSPWVSFLDLQQFLPSLPFFSILHPKKSIKLKLLLIKIIIKKKRSYSPTSFFNEFQILQLERRREGKHRRKNRKKCRERKIVLKIFVRFHVFYTFFLKTYFMSDILKKKCIL